jgi:ABC-2 type transport system ATP-binding protein
MVAITTRSLTKRFGTVSAIDSLNLTVEEGEVFGFLGPNGAGKSTTINLLLDYIRPTSGRAYVLGYDTVDNPKAVRRRCGVLPEDLALYDRVSGRRHIEFAIEMNDADDDPWSMLSRMGISDASESLVGEYSQGMRKRLALGMALVGDPDLLLLDEPTAGLDPHGAKQFRQMVRTEAETGTTVFFSSHALSQVERVCDRVGILEAGTLHAVDTIENLRETIRSPSILELAVEENPANLDIGNLHGVRKVESSPGTLRVYCSESDILATVISEVDDAGLKVTDIDVTKHTLHDVFDVYTGGNDE